MDSIDILARLIAFPTVSRDSNLELIGWVRDRLAERGIEALLVHDATGTKANLFATIGPTDRPGVMLSGHTDVVPVEGQDWSFPPFEMTRREGRLHGRGAADMKGFLACALAATLRAARRPLRTPLSLAFSYDEEVGCLGVRRLIAVLETAPVRPAFAIVGEPTAMQVATGHKGKTALSAVCIGREAHSALAPTALNALHLGCDLVAAIRAVQAEIAESGARDGDYDVPFTTLHVGRMQGGTALNIVPNRCEVEFEIRNLAADDPDRLVERIRGEAARDRRARARDCVRGGYPHRGREQLSRARDPAGRRGRRVREGADRGERDDEGGVRHRGRALFGAPRHPDGDLRAGLDGRGASARRVRHRGADRALRRHARGAARPACVRALAATRRRGRRSSGPRAGRGHG